MADGGATMEARLRPKFARLPVKRRTYRSALEVPVNQNRNPDRIAAETGFARDTKDDVEGIIDRHKKQYDNYVNTD